MPSATIHQQQQKRRRPSPTGGKVRGSYVSQACAFCRRRKTRCDGKRPVCTPCEVSGHDCTWSGESAKRPSTKQYVESLRNRIKALETHVASLEGRTAADEPPLDGHTDSPDADDDDYWSASPSEQDDIGQLCVPTEHLVLEDEDLHLYGPTSIFRLEHRDTHSAPPPHIPRRHSRSLSHPAPSSAASSSSTAASSPSVPSLPSSASSTTSFLPDPPCSSPPSPLHHFSPQTEPAYVLWADGADPAAVDPALEWDRFLPKDANAACGLDRREHDRCLDLLFKFFTSWCMRIVPALFLRDLHRAITAHTLPPPPAHPAPAAPPRTPHYSPMLHAALVALSASFSDSPRVRQGAEMYARAAKSCIEHEGDKPSLAAVHALSMLASFHSGRGEQGLGYLYFGMSGRMSQALGLSVDCSPWVRAGLISRDDMLARNWALWTTFDNDVCWSLYVGRDFCVSSPPETRIPVPFADAGFDRAPWHHPPSGVPPQPCLLSRTFAETCKLMVIARRIMAVVNNLTSPDARHTVNYTAISRIDVDLNTWKESLPPDVDITLSSRASALPHRLMLHLAYWWLFILLHRPFYRRQRAGGGGGGAGGAERDIDHVKLCNRAAENIMDLLSTWRTLYTLRFVPITLLQVAFSAGTIFLLAAVHATAGARLAHVSLAHALAQAELCVAHLRDAGASWGCARQIAGILSALVGAQLRPRLAMRAVDSRIADAARVKSEDETHAAAAGAYAQAGGDGAFPAGARAPQLFLPALPAPPPPPPGALDAFRACAPPPPPPPLPHPASSALFGALDAGAADGGDAWMGAAALHGGMVMQGGGVHGMGAQGAPPGGDADIFGAMAAGPLGMLCGGAIPPQPYMPFHAPAGALFPAAAHSSPSSNNNHAAADNASCGPHHSSGGAGEVQGYAGADAMDVQQTQFVLTEEDLATLQHFLNQQGQGQGQAGQRM